LDQKYKHTNTDSSFLNEVPNLVPVLHPSDLGTAAAPGLGPAPALGGRRILLAAARVVTPSTTTAPASGPPPSAAVSGARAGTPPSTAVAAAISIPLGASGIHADLQLPAVVLPTVEGVHRILGIPLVVVPDKGKAAAAPRAALQREVDIAHVPVLLKQRHQIISLGTVGQVAHAQGSHPIDVARGAAETATTIAAISVRHA